LRKAIQEENVPGQKMISRYTRINGEEYDEKRKEAYRICSKNKNRNEEEKSGGNTINHYVGI
jgi:hypothetical protein